MVQIANTPLVCLLIQAELILELLLNQLIKDIIYRGIITHNSSKLVSNTIILKDWPKD
jgi:hypothetical protein